MANSPKEDIKLYDESLDTQFKEPNVSDNIKVGSQPEPISLQPEPVNQEAQDDFAWSGSALQYGDIKNEVQDIEDIPEAGNPGVDYDMGHIEKIGRSLMVGLGDVFSSMGDLTDFISGTGSKDVQKQMFGVDVNKPISTAFHDFGSYLESYGDSVPGLKNMEDITWSDLTKLEFWETGVARMLPFSLSLLVPAAGVAKVAQGLSITSKLAKAAQGSKFATQAVKSASKGLSKIGIGKPITTQYAAKLALNSGVKAAVGTVAAGSTANLIEGMVIGGDAMNQAIEQGIEPKLAGSVGRQVFVDNLKSMLSDVAQYALWTGQVKVGSTFMNFAKKNKIKIPNQTNLKSPSIKPALKNIGKAAGLGAAQGWTDGVIEQFQEVYQEWAVKKNISEAKGQEFMSYMDFFMSDEQKPTRVLSFATSFLMSGLRTAIDTSAENNRIIQRSLQDRETTFQDLKIFEDNLNEGKYSFKLNGEIVELNEEEAKIAAQDATALAMVKTAYAHGELDMLSEQFSAMLEGGQINKEQYDKFTQTIQQVNDLMSSYDDSTFNIAEKRMLAKVAWSNATAKSLLSKKQADIQQRKDIINNNENYSQEVKQQKIKELETIFEAESEQVNNIIEASKNEVNAIELLSQQRKKKAEALLKKQQENKPIANSEKAKEDLKNKTIEEIEVLEKEVGELTDEEYQNFVDNDEVSQDRLSIIAEKIKANEQLTPQEQAIRESKSKEIEQFLQDSLQQEEQVEDDQVQEEKPPVKASAKARKLANENSINLFRVKGTGKNNLITVKDIRKILADKEEFEKTDKSGKRKINLSKDKLSIDRKKIIADVKEQARSIDKLIKKYTIKGLNYVQQKFEQRKLKKAFGLGAGTESIMANIYAKKSVDNIISIQFFNDYLFGQGRSVAGAAAAATVMLNVDSSEKDTFFHENAHIFIKLYKHVKEVKNMLSSVIGTDIFKDTKINYHELLLFQNEAGEIKKVQDIIDISIEQYAKANNVNQITPQFLEQFQGFVNQVMNENGFFILEDNQQSYIQEEALAEIIGRYGEQNPDVFLKDKAKQTTSLLESFKNKVKQSFTQDELKSILNESSDGSFVIDESIESQLDVIGDIIEKYNANFDNFTTEQFFAKSNKISSVLEKNINDRSTKKFRQQLNNLFYKELNSKDDNIVKKATDFYDDLIADNEDLDFKSMSIAQKIKFIESKETGNFNSAKDYASIVKKILNQFPAKSAKYRQAKDYFINKYNKNVKAIRFVYLNGFVKNQISEEEKNILKLVSQISGNDAIEEYLTNLENDVMSTLIEDKDFISNKLNQKIDSFLAIESSKIIETNFSKVGLLKNLIKLINDTSSFALFNEEINKIQELDGNKSILKRFKEYIDETAIGNEFESLYHQLSSFKLNRTMSIENGNFVPSIGVEQNKKVKNYARQSSINFKGYGRNTKSNEYTQGDLNKLAKNIKNIKEKEKRTEKEENILAKLEDELNLVTKRQNRLLEIVKLYKNIDNVTEKEKLEFLKNLLPENDKNLLDNYIYFADIGDVEISKLMFEKNGMLVNINSFLNKERLKELILSTVGVAGGNNQMKQEFIENLILGEEIPADLKNDLLNNIENADNKIVTSGKSPSKILLEQKNYNKFIEEIYKSAILSSSDEMLGEQVIAFDDNGKIKYYNPYQKKNHIYRNLEKLINLSPDEIDNKFSNNLYKENIYDIYEGIYLLIGNNDTNENANNLKNKDVYEADLKNILTAIENNEETYMQPIYDFADKSKRYYTNQAKVLSYEDCVKLLSEIKEQEKLKVLSLIENHNNNASPFNIYNFLTEKTVNNILSSFNLKITNTDKKNTLNLKEDVYGLIGNRFSRSSNKKDIFTEQYHLSSMNNKKNNTHASMLYTINKYYIQDLFQQHYDNPNHTLKNKRAPLHSSPHIATLPDGRLEVVGFEDESVNGFKTADGASYITEETAAKIEQIHGPLSGISGSFKFVGGGQNLDNRTIESHLGPRSTFYFKGHTTVLTEESTKGTVLEGVYKALKAREKKLGDEVLVVAYSDSGIKKSGVKGLNIKKLSEWNKMSAKEINEFQDNFYSVKNRKSLHGYDASNFGISVELDQENITATSAKQQHAATNAIKSIGDEQINDKVDNVIKARTDLIKKIKEENIDKETIEGISSESIDKGINFPHIKNLKEQGNTKTPAYELALENIYKSQFLRNTSKFRLKGTQALQVSDLTVGYQFEGNNITNNDSQLRSIGQEKVGNKYKPAQCIISEKMASLLNLKIGDVILATRIPSSLPSSQVVLEIKSFSNNNDNTIAVHPEVSSILGSDLDGDVLHINATRNQGDSNYNESIDELGNKLIESQIDLYTESKVVDALLKQNVDFKQLTENTKNALNLKDKQELNDLSILETDELFKQTKGNGASIGVICLANTKYNYLCTGNPKLFISQDKSLQIKADGVQYNNLNNNIETLINHGKWQNLILDDGKNGNRERFGFNTFNSGIFITLLRMGVKPETISKLVTNPNFINARVSNKERNEALEQRDKIQNQWNLNELINNGSKNHFKKFKLTMSVIANDFNNISRVADLERTIQGGVLNAAENFNNYETSLSNQPDLKGVIEESAFLTQQVSIWKDFFNKGVNQLTTLNNGYFEGLKNYQVDNKYKTALLVRMLLNFDGGDSYGVMKSLDDIVKKYNIQDEESYDFLNPIIERNLIAVKEFELDAANRENSKAVNRSKIYNNHLQKAFNESNILNLLNISSFSKTSINKIQVTYEGEKKGTSNYVDYWNKITAKIKNKAKQDIYSTEQIQLIGQTFEELTQEQQNIIITYDLIENGWGLFGESLLPYLGQRANQLVNNTMLKLQNDKISNFNEDIKFSIDGKDKAQFLLGQESENLNKITNDKEREELLLLYINLLNNFDNDLNYNKDIYEIKENDENKFIKTITHKDSNFSINIDKNSIDGRKLHLYSKLADFASSKNQTKVNFKKTNTYSNVGGFRSIGEKASQKEWILESGILSKYKLESFDDYDNLKDERVLKEINEAYAKYEKDIETINAIYNKLKKSKKGQNINAIEDVTSATYSKEKTDKKAEDYFADIEKEYMSIRENIRRGEFDKLASSPLIQYLQYHFGRHMASKQLDKWQRLNPDVNFADLVGDGLNKDISKVDLLFSPGDFGATKPQIAFVSRQLRLEHSRQVQFMNKVTFEMNDALTNLYKEKFPNIVQRQIVKGVYKYLGYADYLYSKKLFGNMFEEITELQEKQHLGGEKYYVYETETRLKRDLFEGEVRTENFMQVFDTKNLKSDSVLKNDYKLTDAEIEYLKMYTKYTSFYNKLINNKGLYDKVKGANYIPAIKASTFETYSRRGIFGLYFKFRMGSDNFNNIHVKALNPLTNQIEILTYSSWKQIFQAAPNTILNSYQTGKGKLIFTEMGTVNTSNKDRLMMMRNIHKKAKQLFKQGIDDAGQKIEVQSTLNEAVELDNNKSSNRFLGKRSNRAAYLSTTNIHKSLRQYIQIMSFQHGNSFDGAKLVWNNKIGKYVEMPDSQVSQADNVFEGFQAKKYLLDAASSNLAGSAFYKTGDDKKKKNENAIKYIEKVLRGRFIEGERPLLLTGFETEEKAINFFVNWTMYIALGFNVPAAIGNVAIGKYNAIRQLGGSKWILGEKRYFGFAGDNLYNHENFKKSRLLLKEFGILTYRAEEIAEGVGGNTISGLIFLPMISAENWIQHAQFLGNMTQEEYDSYEVVDGKLQVKDGKKGLSRDRVLELERAVTNVQGRGYSAIDQRYAQIFAVGALAMQFKRWFPTFIADRFKKEYVDDLGKMNVGSIRAASAFLNERFDNGEYPFSPAWNKEYDKLSKARKEAILRLWNGTKGAVVIAMLLGMVKQFTPDKDEKDEETIKFMEKLLGDVFLIVNVPRLTYMANIPAVQTFENLALAASNFATGSEYQRKGKYGKKGDKRYKSYLAQLMPRFAREPLLGVGEERDRKIR